MNFDIQETVDGVELAREKMRKFRKKKKNTKTHTHRHMMAQMIFINLQITHNMQR